MPYDNSPDITVFAETNFRSQKRRFGIKRDDRRRHMYVIGKTGMGKSTLLENMIIDDIIEGHGVGVVDPHGDLVEKILDYIPSYRINDVAYFNPADFDHPIAFNILESIDPRSKHLVVSGLMGVFKKIWPDVWSPRMEYILNNTLLALLDYPGSTMLGVNRMFSDKPYRLKVVERVTDPIVRAFWVDEYAKYTDKFASEATASIQNKVGQFLSASVIRNIVGQVKSTINLRDLMDNRKIVLMNLSKGRIGEDNSRLLGGMLITKIQLSAMERVNVPEPERKDFYLYVDEFQNFATDSFANILSEARKYRLNLAVAHQYIEQLEDTVRAAVFGNVGTLIAFRVGAGDAEVLEKEFTPRFVLDDLVNIPKFNIYLKLMVDGVATDPFSAQVLPPWTKDEITGNKEKVITASRERYAEKREIIEEKINRWADSRNPISTEGGSGSGSSSGGSRRDDHASHEQKPGFPAKCDRCGKDVMLPFAPDGVRPVYCQDCYKLVKDGSVPPVQPKRATPPPTPQSTPASTPVPAPVSPPTQPVPTPSVKSEPAQTVRSETPNTAPPASSPVRSETRPASSSGQERPGSRPPNRAPERRDDRGPRRESSSPRPPQSSGGQRSSAPVQSRPTRPPESTPRPPAPPTQAQSHTPKPVPPSTPSISLKSLMTEKPASFSQGGRPKNPPEKPSDSMFDRED